MANFTKRCTRTYAKLLNPYEYEMLQTISKYCLR